MMKHTIASTTAIAALAAAMGLGGKPKPALPAPVGVEAARVRGWAAAPPVEVAWDIHQAAIAWSAFDAARAQEAGLVDGLTADQRLAALLAQAGAAATAVRSEMVSEAMFVATYMSREKRGQPRRLRLKVRRQPDGALVIERAA